MPSFSFHPFGSKQAFINFDDIEHGALGFTGSQDALAQTQI